MGRWVTRDPIGYDAGDMNLYQYVGGMPLVGLDPDGEKCRLFATTGGKVNTRVMAWVKWTPPKAGIGSPPSGTTVQFRCLKQQDMTDHCKCDGIFCNFYFTEEGWTQNQIGTKTVTAAQNALFTCKKFITLPGQASKLGGFSLCSITKADEQRLHALVCGSSTTWGVPFATGRKTPPCK